MCEGGGNKGGDTSCGRVQHKTWQPRQPPTAQAGITTADVNRAQVRHMNQAQHSAAPHLCARRNLLDAMPHLLRLLLQPAALMPMFGRHAGQLCTGVRLVWTRLELWVMLLWPAGSQAALLHTTYLHAIQSYKVRQKSATLLRARRAPGACRCGGSPGAEGSTTIVVALATASGPATCQGKGNHR